MRKTICLIGDVIVDVSLKSKNIPLKMRLGGIVHAARALWALDIPYVIAYFAPSYLDSHIREYLDEFDCQGYFKLGDTTNCPNVMLIEEVKEVGDQGYEFLLRDNVSISYDEDAINDISIYNDFLCISGNYDLVKIVNGLPKHCRISLDVANNVEDISYFDGFKKRLDTVFISTSSSIFKRYYQPSGFNIDEFFSLFKIVSQRIILKESRGGSRGYEFETSQFVQIGSQTGKITHSVGVGDTYDATFIALVDKFGFAESLHYASWIAAEYAKTTYPDDFKKMVERVMKVSAQDLISLGGCILPWENRENGHIYIAAPDFNFVDIRPIDLVFSSLEYHNFKPHRPIKENGQMEANATEARKQDLFNADMELMDKCNMMIAVLLYDDPGTLIEIGIAAERKMPVFVYDPYNRASNCMLTQLPDLVSGDADEIISAVFQKYSEMLS
jgi:nucleoside 2-deoxyribosyltransferase